MLIHTLPVLFHHKKRIHSQWLEIQQEKKVGQLIVSNVESTVCSGSIVLISEICWTTQYAHIVLFPSFLSFLQVTTLKWETQEKEK